MRRYGRRHGQWLCPSGCHTTQAKGQGPCSKCCGYTTDQSKQYQGRTTAATKN